MIFKWPRGWQPTQGLEITDKRVLVRNAFNQMGVFCFCFFCFSYPLTYIFNQIDSRISLMKLHTSLRKRRKHFFFFFPSVSENEVLICISSVSWKKVRFLGNILIHVRLTHLGQLEVVKKKINKKEFTFEKLMQPNAYHHRRKLNNKIKYAIVVAIYSPYP